MVKNYFEQLIIVLKKIFFDSQTSFVGDYLYICHNLTIRTNNMNRVDYINALKSALEINKEEREDIEQYHKMVLENPDNAQLNTFIGLIHFFLVFLSPMYRVLCLIENRIREEHLDENDISKCSYPLMMMEDVFVNMTQDISLYTVCNVIIDKRLVCCPYAKSELKRSIKERDLQLFKDIIKEYNIDYKPASDICSHICICSNMLGDIQNVLESKEEGAVNSLSDKESEENLNIEVRALYEDVLMIIRKKMEEDYCSDEEITVLQDFGDWLRNNTFDFSSPENCIQSFGLLWRVCFGILVNTLNEYTREQKLTIFDNRIITQFIEMKKAEMPIVQGFFTLFTKGDVLGDDFVFTEAEDDEFLEMIEQCVSTETDEQQMLPDNENTGVGNLEPVDNPKLEELKTSNENDSSRFIYSHIRGFIKVENVEGFLKHLHKMIEEQDRYCKRIFVIRAAWKTGKIESPCQRYKEYTKEFPDMFGTKQEWSKYMNQKKYNDDCDEISRFIPYFDNW